MSDTQIPLPSLADRVRSVKGPDGAWGGTLGSQMGTAPISKATLEGTRMTVTFTGPDGSAGSMLLMFEGKTVTGDWSVAGMASKLSGARP